MPIKIDLHVHSFYSRDCSTSLRQLLLAAKKAGLDGIALTDHDTNAGALKLAKEKSLLVIPGIEVSSLHGHILALNVFEPVEPKLCVTDTVDRIHQLGGIAVIAHPSVILKTGFGFSMRSASNLDAVEVINAATFPFLLSTLLSTRLATRFSLPQTAGSDAHYPDEVGRAYTLLNAENSRDDIIDAIKKGRTVPLGRPISWGDRISRGTHGMRETLTGRR